MSDDYISRQAAIDAANKVIERDTSGNNDVVNAMIAWSEYIKSLSLPSVNPQEPKTGRWEKVSMDKYVQHANYYHKCDVCGEQHIEPTPYCPYCGAKMQ